MAIKKCKMCFREFEGEDVWEDSPAMELGDIFARNTGIEDISDLCPECKEELGVINFLGFGQ